MEIQSSSVTIIVIIVVIGVVISLCEALFSESVESAASRKKYDPREGRNQATLSYGLPRCSLPIATVALGAMFSASVSTTPCASFRDKKYDRRSFLCRMR